MIRKSAYETTACQNYVMDKVSRGLGLLMGWRGGRVLPLDVDHAYYVDSKLSSATDVEIPAFAHPIEVVHQGHTDWIVDQRPNTRVDMRSLQSVVVSQSDFVFNNVRAQLSVVYADEGGRMYLERTGDLAMQVYSAWISENLGRRFSLDHGTQYRVSILAGIYFVSMYMPDSDWGQEERLLIAKKVAEGLRVNAEDVLNLLEHMEGGFVSMEDWCQVTRRLSENLRLKDLDVALLYTLLGGTWSGYNAREVACVALEHIPTFLSMLYVGLSERGFNNTAFVKLVQRKGKREGAEFQQRVKGIFLSYRRKD